MESEISESREYRLTLTPREQGLTFVFNCNTQSSAVMESATYQPVASETKLAATQHSNRKKQLLERDTLLLKPNTSKPLLQSPAPVVTSKMGLLKTFILCLIVSGSTLGGLVLLIKVRNIVVLKQN